MSTALATPLSSQSMIVATQGLAAADLGSESVVLDPTAGKYYGLNEVAARILELVESPKSVRDVQAALMDEYDVDADELRTDLDHFLRELHVRGLIALDQ